MRPWVYATFTMGNRFLGVQIWVVFAFKTVTLLWQRAKSSGHPKRLSFVAETQFIPITITKGLQLISETNIPLLIPRRWRLCTDIRAACACVCGDESVQ